MLRRTVSSKRNPFVFLAAGILASLMIALTTAGQVQVASATTWAATVPEGQKTLIEAQNSGRGLNFVEVQSTVVSEILPDDVSGRPHQKWVVTLANNRKLMAVYNSDMGDRIPIKVGEVVSMAGQYIWDRNGGLIHWLHKDPRGRRPDGWVEVGGVKYGQ